MSRVHAGVVIQARLTSHRLPAKVLLPIGRYPALQHTIERVRVTGLPFVVAIPDTQANDPLARWLATVNAPTLRGPEHDVRARFIMAAAALGAHGRDRVVRVTGDCPFVAPQAILGLAHATDVTARDRFWDNVTIRYVPRGLDVQVATAELLYALPLVDATPHGREHVFPPTDPSMVQKADEIGGSTSGGSRLPDDFPEWRWCLDTMSDYMWFRRVAALVDTTPPHPTVEELVHLLRFRPDLIRRESDYAREHPPAARRGVAGWLDRLRPRRDRAVAER